MNALPQNPKDVVTKLVEMVTSTGDTHASMLAAFGDERTAQATQDSLRAFAARLREGAPAMRATGWYALLHGVESMAAKGES